MFILKRYRKQSFGVRFLALLQVALLFFSGSPAAMALQFSAGSRSAGVSQGDGGQGSAPNLQNAGAASAALTAALAQKSLQKSQSVITALTTAQKQAANAAKSNPNNGQVNGKTVINGLQLCKPGAGNGQVAGLVPYYTAQNPAPNGSQVPTGAVPIPGTWSGVSGLSQTLSGSSSAPSSSTVTITQNQQSAYLYWSSFNVGAQTTLNFRQSGNLGTPGTWIAFNKVMGSSDPSHIFGQINSPGQVYILNQNGVLFHAGSEVNVQSLVAATLPVNTKLAGDSLSQIAGGGLANNSGDQFLFSALPLAQSQNGFADNFDPTITTPSQLSPVSISQLGSVVVDAGARITTTISADGTGGKVALIGPAVINAGIIDTPNGQSIFAAGLQVGMVPHLSADASLRGLDVFVGQVSAVDPVSQKSVNAVSYINTDFLGNESVNSTPIGTVINNGMIGSLDPAGNTLSPHAAITLVGSSITQNGSINTSTSTSLNGRIDLVSSFNAEVNKLQEVGQPYFFIPTLSPGINATTGRINFGPSSVTEVLPDFTDTSTIAGSLPLPSVIAVIGNSVDVGNNATILAPGAAINSANPASSINSSAYFLAKSAILPSGISIQAGNWFTLTGVSQFVEGAVGDQNQAGSITVGTGADISSAGTTGALVDSSQYIQTIQFRGAELANSPLQRNSPIRGKNINVDFRLSGTYDGKVWVGSPFGDLTGYAALIQRGIGQLTSSGGTVSLKAGNSVSLAQGSAVDVSGGWIKYLGGMFTTSKLITANGNAVDISQATPDQVYSAIIAHPNPIDEGAYYSGGSGGGLTIQSPSMVLAGTLRGTVVNGPLQNPGIKSLNTYTPTAALSLQILSQKLVGGVLYNDSPYQPSVLFTSQAVPNGEIGINPEFFGSQGFGSLTLNNHDGTVTMSPSTKLQLGPGGLLNLSGSTIQIAGTVNDPGGTIALVANDVSYSQAVELAGASEGPTEANAGRGLIKIDRSASLCTAGVITIGNSSDAGNSAINGGSITLSAYSVEIDHASRLNVSGGLFLASANAKPDYGNAGSITIKAGRDPEFATIHERSNAAIPGGLLLNGLLLGYAGQGAKSGSLSLATTAFQIGGATDNPLVTLLGTDFFNQGGFANIALAGMGIASNDGSFANETPGMLIAANSVIHPVVQNWIYTLSGLMSANLATITLPQFYRPSVYLNLSANGLTDQLSHITLIAGKAEMQSESSIELDPRASFSRNSSVPVIQESSLSLGGSILNVNGSMSVPGGSIFLSGAKSYPNNDLSPAVSAPTLVLGGTARVSAAGEAIQMTDPLGLGRHFGAVLAGGTIVLGPNGNPANIMLAEGSLVNVSGSSGSFYLNQNRSVKAMESSAGTIALNGSQELLVQGDLIGKAGGSTVLGGTLLVSSGRFYNQNLNQVQDPHDITLIVTQDVSQTSGLASSSPVAGATTMGVIAVNTIMNGGFAALTLSGNVLFNGAVNLSLPGSITVANNGVLETTGAVVLQAPYVALGQTFANPLQSGSLGFSVLGTPALPTGGLGSLSVKASNIDLGNLLLNGMDSASFDAHYGAIRGDGTLDIAGDLQFSAAQISPLTETEFKAIAYPFDKGTTGLYDASVGNGSINITQAGPALSLPLSAVGEVSFYASSIVQNGTIAAPFGRINLGWNGVGAPPIDPLSGMGFHIPITATLQLGPGSICSLTGFSENIPYGIIMNGNQWIDPAGNNITATGPLVESMTAGGVSFVSKGISLSAGNISQSDGAVINLNGGGNLSAFEWIRGTGGTTDVTAPNAGSFAILPGYSHQLFPVSPFSNLSVTGGDGGYISPSLQIGEQITLAGGGGLKAGTYTILPSRYALLQGAFLITPQKKAQELESASLSNPDGSVVMSGHLSGTTISSLDPYSAISGVNSLFRVASSEVLAKEADYKLTVASKFLPSIQAAMPVNDAARLSINAISSLSLNGTVLASGFQEGHGAAISLSGSRPFLIGGTIAPADPLYIDLSAKVLSSWNAGSLLIGGTEQVTSTGIEMTSTTSQITVNNSGNLPNDSPATLSAQDLNLISSGGITVTDGSTISSIGSGSQPTVSLTGEGVLLRVSSDPTATVNRNGADGAAVAGYSIGAANLSGGSVSLDSSSRGLISQNASILSKTINLNAGLIAVEFTGSPVNLESGALNLNGTFLTSLSSAQSLNLTSRSSIDFHGDGLLGSSKLQHLGLHASAILGDNSGNVLIQTGSLLLDDPQGSAAIAFDGVKATGGGLVLTGGDFGILTLGVGNVNLGSFATVTANFGGGITGSGAGICNVDGDLVMNTPLLTGANSSSTTMSAKGLLVLNSTQTAPRISAGRGVSLSISGDNGVTIAAPISAEGGMLSIESINGDLIVSSSINAAGFEKTFFGGTRLFANAGSVSLLADQGNLILSAGTLINLSAQPAGGNAGTLSLRAPSISGNLQIDNAAMIQALAGSGGSGGVFIADLGSYDASGGVSDLTSLETLLSKGGFSQSQNISIRVGDVLLPAGGTARAHSFTLSADQGSIDLGGTIDASGITGGYISIFAGENLRLASSAKLSVHADGLNTAGQGGAIDLEAGMGTALDHPSDAAVEGTPAAVALQSSGILDLVPGSTLDLGIGVTESPAGVLTLAAPQNPTQDGVQIPEIASTITGASRIHVIGNYTLDANQPTPLLDNGTLYDYQNNNQFQLPLIDNLAAAGLAEASGFASKMENSLAPWLSGPYASLIQVNPGLQILNSQGSLELQRDLNLSAARYGPLLQIVDGSGNLTGATIGSTAGALTIRAAGDILINGSISDGFTSSSYSAPLLPVAMNSIGGLVSQSSWSYRITAGADFAVADPKAVQNTAHLTQNGGMGSIKLGLVTADSNIDFQNPDPTVNLTADTLNGNYQVIRTGTGDVTLSAGVDIQLLNQFATIYTAGALLPDQTLGGTFDLPQLDPYTYTYQRQHSFLIGEFQKNNIAPAQFSSGGGNVELHAGRDIADLQALEDPNSFSYSSDPQPLVNFDGTLTMVAASSRQLPVDWVSRRGSLNGDGNWGTFRNGEVASTAWWVDFANFFEGVGALGSGNVTMTAGRDISNVDASIPTQARMSGLISGSHQVLDTASSRLFETPGGNLTINAGRNLDAGDYYVENGYGSINVVGSVITNPSRDVNGSNLNDLANVQPVGTTPTSPELWMPTSFLLGGNTSMNVTVGGNALIGPVGNVFLQAPGGQNYIQDKTYFSTYGASASFTATSLGGDLTMRTVLAATSGAQPAFQAWISASSFYDYAGASYPTTYQPWTRSAEFSPNDSYLSHPSELLPGSLSLRSYSGNITLAGDFTLNPAPMGNFQLLSAGQVSGLYIQQSGLSWASAVVNLSDAIPSTQQGSFIPSPVNPASQYLLNFNNIGAGALQSSFSTLTGELISTAGALTESASYIGAESLIQTKILRHDPGLHSADPFPLQIEALTGDITGITLFSPKASDILSGGSITDVEFALQNNNPMDVSIVSAAGDIRPYDPNTSQISVARQNLGVQSLPPVLAGDIELAGPGTLEVISGGTINLGSGNQNVDGTGAGITTIGNVRNPYLSFQGADLVVSAGVVMPAGLASYTTDFTKLLTTATTLPDASNYYTELLTLVNQGGDNGLYQQLLSAGSLPGISSANLTDDQKSRIALNLFYTILTDSGVDHGNPLSQGYLNYKAGESAISALFPTHGTGDLVVNSRSIRTVNGGAIDLLVPGGGVVLANYDQSASLAPPGIVTSHGGNIDIYTQQNVSLGVGRIFTLRGGPISIWSEEGNIAAGAAAKTVASAPPTRVIIDPGSAAVQTDLAGLATGGGIGTLQTIKGVPPSAIVLVAVKGSIDAGDAGIRSSGNLILSATKILNADNIHVGGFSVGVPPPAASSAPAAAPAPAPAPASAPSSASTAAAAASSAADKAADKTAANQAEETPSVFSIDIMGYGGGDGDGGEGSDDQNKKAANSSSAPIQASL